MVPQLSRSARKSQRRSHPRCLHCGDLTVYVYRFRTSKTMCVRQIIGVSVLYATYSTVSLDHTLKWNTSCAGDNFFADLVETNETNSRFGWMASPEQNIIYWEVISRKALWTVSGTDVFVWCFHPQLLESAFKKETVGLVTREQFVEKVNFLCTKQPVVAIFFHVLIIEISVYNHDQVSIVYVLLQPTLIMNLWWAMCQIFSQVSCILLRDIWIVVWTRLRTSLCMCGSQRVNLRTKLEEEEKEKQQKLALEYVYKLHCTSHPLLMYLCCIIQTVHVLLSYNVPSLWFLGCQHCWHVENLQGGAKACAKAQEKKGQGSFSSLFCWWSWWRWRWRYRWWWEWSSWYVLLSVGWTLQNLRASSSKEFVWCVFQLS